ncbi:MAG: hypothetical protein WC977_08720 [Anaerovoracaceae bacterium]
MIKSILLFLLIHYVISYYLSPHLIKRNRATALVLIDGFVWAYMISWVIGLSNILFISLFIIRIILELNYSKFVPKGSTFDEFKKILYTMEIVYIVIAIAIGITA